GVQPNPTSAAILPPYHGEFVAFDDEAPFLLFCAFRSERLAAALAADQYPRALELLQFPLCGILGWVCWGSEQNSYHHRELDHPHTPLSIEKSFCRPSVSPLPAHPASHRALGGTGLPKR